MPYETGFISIPANTLAVGDVVEFAATIALRPAYRMTVRLMHGAEVVREVAKYWGEKLERGTPWPVTRLKVRKRKAIRFVSVGGRFTPDRLEVATLTMR